MNPYQRFFLVVALIGALIFYVAGVVLMTPPVTAALLSKETITVTSTTVETRTGEKQALPAIDVRDSGGNIVLLQGYGWMDGVAAREVATAHPVGQTVEAVRYDGKLWRGITGFRDTLWFVVSLIGAFVALFGLWMVWKVRKAR